MFCGEYRRNRSCDHPPPRTTNGRPLITNWRYPAGAMVCPGTTGVRYDVTVRMPKSSSYRSVTSRPTFAVTSRWYIGWSPIWYGHQIAG